MWRVSLALPPRRVQRLYLVLSPDERARADRFRFKEHRERFIAARGMLRTILGRYLDRPPEHLQFCYNPYGKPALKPGGARGLDFNISHSQDMALYALAWDRPLGIDLEYLRDQDAALEQLVARFFSPSEREALRKLPSEKKTLAFFKVWTRKEAYMKARGQGLTLPLQQFTVSVAPDEPARLLNDNHDPQAVTRWTLWDVDPGHGYVAALAARGASWRVACWQWPEATFDRE